MLPAARFVFEPTRESGYGEGDCHATRSTLCGLVLLLTSRHALADPGLGAGIAGAQAREFFLLSPGLPESDGMARTTLERVAGRFVARLETLKTAPPLAARRQIDWMHEVNRESSSPDGSLACRCAAHPTCALMSVRAPTPASPRPSC